MNWYFKNLLCGFKFCTFLNCEPKDIKTSWNALFAILITITCSHAIIDSIAAGQDATFNRNGWFFFHSILFATTFTAAFLATLITKRSSALLDIWVIFYNSYLFILIPYFILAAAQPEWLSDKLSTSIDSLIAVWAFLIAFRIIFQAIDPPPIAGAIAAAVIALSIYTFNENVYMYPFFYGNYGETEEEEERFPLTSEELFSMQQDLVQKELEGFIPSKKGNVDIYGVSFGSYGYQDVFLKESKYVSERMKKVLGISNGVLTLINNEKVNEETPLANTTNLKQALNYIKSIIQPEEDIVMIFLTSHGSKKSGLSVSLNYRYSMNNLSPEKFAEALEQSGIKNKIIIISACHSGIFIPELKDENTLIITASAENKQSYGCSDNAELTFFANAYFKQALDQTTDLVKAFEISKSLIEKREKDEDLSPPSDPQIFIGEHILQSLQHYKNAELAPIQETSSK
jgi:hypothetical protein